jgi:hypothetical protein
VARELLIALAGVGHWDRKAFDLAANYLLKLKLPALSRLCDEKQNQPVPHLALLSPCRVLHGR